MPIKDMRSFLERLAVLIQAVDKEGGVTSTHRRQFPPAKESDIAAAGKKSGIKLPPSYAAFLRLHNGWEGINAGDICVVGVSGGGYGPAKKTFESDVKMFEKEYKREGKDYAAQLRSRELKDANVIYLPHHIPVALNYNGDYWVIDKNRPAKGGEYEIAVVELGENVRRRYASFGEFLENYAKRLLSELPASKRASFR